MPPHRSMGRVRADTTGAGSNAGVDLGVSCPVSVTACTILLGQRSHRLDRPTASAVSSDAVPAGGCAAVRDGLFSPLPHAAHVDRLHEAKQREVHDET